MEQSQTQQQKEGIKGTLIMNFVNAQLSRDTELIGKMDPFIEVKINRETQRTLTHENGGKNPVWNEQMVFRCAEGDKVNIKVWDEELFERHDEVGESTYIVREHVKEGKDSYDELLLGLYYKNSNVGQLNVQVILLRDGQEQKSMKESQEDKIQEQASQQIQVMKRMSVVGQGQDQSGQMGEMVGILNQIEEMKNQVERLQVEAKERVLKDRQLNRQRENAQLQIQEIYKQKVDNQIKSECYKIMRRDMLEGVFKGVVEIRQVEFVYERGFLESALELSGFKVFVMIGHEGEKGKQVMRYMYTGQKGRESRKSYKWEKEENIHIKDSQTFLVQVYHQYQFSRDLVGQGGMSLLNLNENQIERQINIWNGKSIMGNLKIQVRFEMERKLWVSEMN